MKNLKWKNTGLKSDIARAKGLGSAHEGVHHWMMQRVTALINAPLAIWMVYSIVKLQGASYAEFTTWLQHPLNAVLSIIFILSSFYHAALGSQVIAEDYIGCECFRALKLIGMKIFFFVIAVASVFAILKVAL